MEVTEGTVCKIWRCFWRVLAPFASLPIPLLAPFLSVHPCPSDNPARRPWERCKFPQLCAVNYLLTAACNCYMSLQKFTVNWRLFV